MALYILANLLGSAVQITTLPLPVLAALQASGLVFNAIFASLLLGEPFDAHARAGTLLVCTGALLVATFGAVREPLLDLPQLLRLLRRPRFLGWLAATVAVVALAVLAARLLLLRTGTPVLSSPRRLQTARGMLYGLAGGVLAAHTLLLAKSVVGLLAQALLRRGGARPFHSPCAWLLAAATAALALVQLLLLHRGLELCSTSVLYPLVFCVFNVTATMDGLVYFADTAAGLTGTDALCIALGTAVLLHGVLVLSWRLEGEWRTDGLGAKGLRGGTAGGTPGGTPGEGRSAGLSEGQGERQPVTALTGATTAAATYGACE
ncbi:hypothetical protein KEM52_000409 [Ascosphaera acerosa]|nr:hypothetical protein KEM52_000409 [Ascosphaera acerosa]